jgi:hypothetical protein
MVSGIRHRRGLLESNIPRVPDAGPQTHEYLCVRYVDGEEWGIRESINIRSSYDLALREKERLEGLRPAGEVVILRRAVGAWEDSVHGEGD